MLIIAFVTELAYIRRIVDHISKPVTPPDVAQARAPPIVQASWDITESVAV